MEVKLIKEPDNECDKEAIGIVKYALPKGVLYEVVDVGNVFRS